jgi:uncharacterized protein YraI
MNPHKKSQTWLVGLTLIMAMLACNLPSSTSTETPTPAAVTETATLPALPTVITEAEDCVATATRDANMRTGPGQAWPVVSQLASGNSAQVTGHNGDKTWWQLNDSAWISASLTTTSGDCSGVLVVGFPAPPEANNPPESQQPTQAPTNPPQAQPTQAPTNAPLVNMAFEVDYEITWFCGNEWRVSFKIYNQGNANIESVYYSVEAPAGSYVNSGTINNAPFEATTKESQPACAQPVGHGGSSLAPGNGMTVPINLSPIPAGVTEGFLYIEVCSQNNRGGVCESQIQYFYFTT